MSIDMTNKDEFVMLGHGSGGIMMKRLIDEVFFDIYGGSHLKSGDDAALLDIKNIASELKLGSGEKIAFSTDTFVVTPHFFSGGNIGKLAVCGTVNDVATSGAKPIAISVSFVLEEGFPLSDLREICSTIASVSVEAGVEVVTGDTKVVNKGCCDGIFINTSGMGIIPDSVSLSGRNCQVGDKVIITGTLGDHGISIMKEREGLKLLCDVESDAAPLNHLAADVLEAAPNVRCFRDPTRGGLASTLNEFADQSDVSILIEEDKLPVRPEVRGACEMLGLDVCHVANEGKFVIVVAPDEAEEALQACRANKYGKDAAIIGEIVEPKSSEIGPKVYLKTAFGSSRILDMLVGEQLPRIC